MRWEGDGVWRDRDFRIFFVGHALSFVGVQVGAVALPLVALLTLGSSEAEVGLLQACAKLPYLGIPLLAGVYVDRRRKRPVMIRANAVRAAALLAIPIIGWWGGLSLPLLCVLAVVVGTCAMVFEVAELAYVPSLVGRDRLTSANSATVASIGAADLGGPGLGGVLVQVLGPAWTVGANGLTCLLSVLTLSRLRHVETSPPPRERRDLWAELVEGLRAVLDEARMRGIAFQGLVFNLFHQGFLVSFLLLAVGAGGVGPGWYGLLLGIDGGGAMVGAALTRRWAARLGYGRAFLTGALLGTVPCVAVPLLAAAPDPWRLGAWVVLFGIAGFGTGMILVIGFTLRQAFTPDHLLGRMNASMRQLLYAGIPVGAAGAGLLASAIGARLTVLVSAVGLVTSVPFVLRLVSLGELPHPDASQR